MWEGDSLCVDLARFRLDLLQGFGLREDVVQVEHLRQCPRSVCLYENQVT
jgi:hypothetical protein